jgi:hypothetical protein
MMLFKAKLAAKDELATELERAGVTVEQLKAYLAKKTWRGSSLFYPRHGTVASTAANLVQHVAADLKGGRFADIVSFFKHRADAKKHHHVPQPSSKRAAAPAPAEPIAPLVEKAPVEAVLH